MPAWCVSAAKIVALGEIKKFRMWANPTLLQLTFHLNIYNAELTQLLQIIHLVGLCELAEGAIKASLALIEIVRAHRLARDGLVRILCRIGERLQFARKLSIQLRWSMNDFAENCLLEIRKVRE